MTLTDVLQNVFNIFKVLLKKIEKIFTNYLVRRQNMNHFDYSLASRLAFPHNGHNIPCLEYLASSTKPNHSQGEQK